MVANDLRHSGVTIVFVGTGNGDFLGRLSLITGDPTNVLFAPTLQESVRREFIERIAIRSCMAGKNISLVNTCVKLLFVRRYLL